MEFNPTFRNLISPRKIATQSVDIESIKMTAKEMLSAENCEEIVEEFMISNQWETMTVIKRMNTYEPYNRNVEYDDRLYDLFVITDENIFQLLEFVRNVFKFTFRNIKGLYRIQCQILKDVLNDICVFLIPDRDIILALEYVEGGEDGTGI